MVGCVVEVSILRRDVMVFAKIVNFPRLCGLFILRTPGRSFFCNSRARSGSFSPPACIGAYAAFVLSVLQPSATNNPLGRNPEVFRKHDVSALLLWHIIEIDRTIVRFDCRVLACVGQTWLCGK